MNIKLIDKATKAGFPSRANEDRIVLGNNLFMVLDGATSLGEQQIESFESDALWFVDAMPRHFLPKWEAGSSFRSALHQALDCCMEEYEDLTHGKLRSGVLRKHELPSAGMAAIAVEKNTIWAFRLGDCACYCKYTQGGRSMFGKSALESLDSTAVSALVDEIRRGSTVETARHSISGLLRSHRSRMNGPDGYGVLSLSKECMSYLESKQVEREGLTGILLFTDGFGAIEQYRDYGIETLFRECKRRGLDDMIRETRELETDDEFLLTFPRLKQHDDSSALFLEVRD